MESKKRYKWTFFTKEKQTHRLRGWTYGYQGKKVVGGIVREFGIDIYLIYMCIKYVSGLFILFIYSIDLYFLCLKNIWLHSMWDVSSPTAASKSLQSCPTLCDPINGSPPGSAVSGILQARTLEWVAISFSNAGKWKVKVKLLSRVRLLATPWTTAYQAPPSMGFSRQEYWSGVPLPSPIYAK